jgi:hypothetical protein
MQKMRICSFIIIQYLNFFVSIKVGFHETQMPQWRDPMKQDPFGSLNDWGTVLELLEQLSTSNQLKDCQPGLIRILQHKGNWQLREEVLKRVKEIPFPSDKLVFQVLSILADDNTYYDVRILAGKALIQWQKGFQGMSMEKINREIRKVVEKLRSTPQPFFLEDALSRLSSVTEFIGTT